MSRSLHLIWTIGQASTMVIHMIPTLEISRSQVLQHLDDWLSFPRKLFLFGLLVFRSALRTLAWVSWYFSDPCVLFSRAFRKCLGQKGLWVASVQSHSDCEPRSGRPFGCLSTACSPLSVVPQHRVPMTHQASGQQRTIFKGGTEEMSHGQFKSLKLFSDLCYNPCVLLETVNKCILV